MTPEIKRHLTESKKYAESKIESGQEPPWAWYQYMKLIETIDTILEGSESCITLEESLKPKIQIIKPTLPL